MYSEAVIITPMKEKKARNFFFDDPRSAMEPRSGATIATITPAREFAIPSLAVLTVASDPELQYSLKNTGKKPAMTVVANAEFAQSYNAQLKTAFLV